MKNIVYIVALVKFESRGQKEKNLEWKNRREKNRHTLKKKLTFRARR